MSSFGESRQNPRSVANRPSVSDRVPRVRGPGSVPTVIFFHGRGLDEGTVEQVAHGFRGARILAPRGPITKHRGYTWFENERIGVADPASVQAAVLYVDAWLGRTVPQGTKPWLCGFSNGGALVGRLLLDRPERYSGGAILSGPLIDGPPWPAGRLQGMPLFYARGTQDTIVQPALFVSAECYLRDESGADVEFARFAAGHEITIPGVEALSKWFLRALTASGRI